MPVVVEDVGSPPTARQNDYPKAAGVRVFADLLTPSREQTDGVSVKRHRFLKIGANGVHAQRGWHRGGIRSLDTDVCRGFLRAIEISLTNE